MVSITFDSVSKSYGSEVVIRKFSATVEDGEFLVLLGPSGCGKSTILRMLAGLIDVSSGSIRFDDGDVSRLSPKKRGIAFVFQSYALYPHMTVRQNIAFPLVMDKLKWWWHLPFVNGPMRRKAAKLPDVAQRVNAAAQMLELTDYLERRPRALSGGQRQRVAVARSVVREPSVYLLDEPLSNLDAKLRGQMRAEISALHRRVRKTFVYVTHDQVEAMTMGTRVLVLDDGVVQQFGTPTEVYQNPANVFVARFIGAPAMNVFRVQSDGSRVTAQGAELSDATALARRQREVGSMEVDLGVRPENIVLSEAALDGFVAIPVHVQLTEQLGAETVIGFKIGASDGTIEIGGAASRSLLFSRTAGTIALDPGTELFACFRASDAHLFDSASGVRMTEGAANAQP